MKTDKLLIIKHGSIGDIFMSLILLEAISQEYSNITPLSTSSGIKFLNFININLKNL